MSANPGPASLADVVLRLPAPGERRIALRVTPAAERALRQGHPWVFAESIRRQSRDGAPGDLAIAFDHERGFLAAGLYDPNSPIRLLALQHGKPAQIDERWFRSRLGEAVAARSPLLTSETTGCRLVHGENDGLPGLIVDCYAQTLVLKLYTSAWVPHLRTFAAALQQEFPAERLLLRLGRSALRFPELLHGLTDGAALWGPELAGPVTFLENGLRFEADPRLGHKTGFYLDQRENRARAERLAQGKSVLNVFAYTGAFALYAARGGARTVVSVDISRPALEAAGRNFDLNRHVPAVAAAEHATLVEDAFAALERLGRARRRFDLVILDPPAFANQRAGVKRALDAYTRLTFLALGVLRRSGTLVFASCTRQVSADAFFEAVHLAARRAGRPLRDIERTGHPLDHPVRFKEGAYLKCLFAELEYAAASSL